MKNKSNSWKQERKKICCARYSLDVVGLSLQVDCFLPAVGQVDGLDPVLDRGQPSGGSGYVTETGKRKTKCQKKCLGLVVFCLSSLKWKVYLSCQQTKGVYFAEMLSFLYALQLIASRKKNIKSQNI